MLDTPEDREKALMGLACTANFYLQYQGCNDLELQRQFGQLFHRVMAANYPDLQPPLAALKKQRIKNSRKIRVGYISHHFREHTIGKLFLGWLKHSNRDKFEIYCYYTDRPVDAMTAQFQQYCDVFHHIPYAFAKTYQQISADALDILVFPDIGMCSDTDKIAGLRLAPIQCAAWGHPITTGLPTIDYYLTSDLMEPENAQSHYVEKLVRLPKIGICYPQPQIPDPRKTRADFHLSDRSIIYLSCQSLYKYLPQYDYIFAEIAQCVSQAQFVFLASPTGDYITAKFQQRLHRAFANYGLDSQKYCVILPRLSAADYANLNLLSDVFLDTIGWSGGNTTLEAIACNLPIVTLPSEFMRGRHAYAMLQVLEVLDTIAKNEMEYVEIAVRLGINSQWRQEIVQRMSDRHDALYGDQASVQALEVFFEQQVQAFYL